MSVETIDLTPPTPPSGAAAVDLTPGTAPGAPATIDASAHSLDDDNAALIIAVPEGAKFQLSTIGTSSDVELPYVYSGSLAPMVVPGMTTELNLPINVDLDRVTSIGEPDQILLIPGAATIEEVAVLADGSFVKNLIRLLPVVSSGYIVSMNADYISHLEAQPDLVAVMTARNWVFS